MRRAVLLILLFGAAGCGGHGGNAISQKSAPKLVLQQSMLGAGYTQFDGGRQVMADRQPGRSDPQRFDRIDGWKSRFKKGGSTLGPLVVESRLDLFKANGGAHQDYLAYLSHYKDWESPEVTGLGDEAHAFTSTTGSGKFAVRYYAIAWRERNATASVSANGFDRKITLEQVLRLARAQEARMAKAS
jgi:hypothetical protein